MVRQHLDLDLVVLEAGADLRLLEFVVPVPPDAQGAPYRFDEPVQLAELRPHPDSVSAWCQLDVPFFEERNAVSRVFVAVVAPM